MRQILLGACLLVSVPVAADSLYTSQSPFARLFSDRKAAQVGDVLHILITELAQASHNTTSDVANRAKTEMGPGLGLLDFIPLIGYGGSSQASSSGKANRSESFSGRIAVTVVGITPTGNLLVEGCRSVTVHRDLQIIKLCGEVRPQDVTADNTVPSYRVANATISYTGSDPLRPGRKVGVVTRILHWLF